MQKWIIKPNDIVIYRGSEYLITRYLDLHSVIAVGSEGIPVKLPIHEIESTKKSKEELIKNHETLTDKEWEIAQERFSILRPILEDRGNGKKIDEISKESKIHKSTIYRWLYNFENTGLVSSLAPIEKNGGRGKSRLSDELDLIINDCIKDVYLNRERKPITQTIREVKTRCNNAGLAPPHDGTIRQRIAQITEYDRLKFRYGEKAAKEAYGAFPGKFPGADYPLSYVQIDHTRLDIIIVDEITRQPVGRPWITLAIDVFSRMVLGYYISFDPPGAMGTGLCIAMAIAPKEDILIKYELESEWPCWGIMKCIHMDNAKEFRGLMIKDSCQQYGIETNFRKVLTPNWGGHIESLLGTFAEEIHTLPGTTFSNVNERDNYKSEKRAALSITEFEKWLLIYITQNYHKKIHSALLTTPLAKYNEGIFGNRKDPGAGLGTGLPPKITDKQKLILDFTPFVKRSIRDNGVTLNNIRYYHESLQKWINAIEPGKGKKKEKRKFIFKVDPRNIKYIYFFEPDLKEYFQVPYADSSKPNMSIWEYREVIRKLVDEGKSNYSEAEIFDAYKSMNEVAEKAVQKTKKIRKQDMKKRARKTDPLIQEKKADPVTAEESAHKKNHGTIKPFDEIEYGSSE